MAQDSAKTETFATTPREVEFVFSPRDFLETVIPKLRRGFRPFRWIAAIFIGAVAIRIIWQDGLAWLPVGMLLVAAEVTSPYSLFLLIFCGFFLCFRPRIRVSYDSSMIEFTYSKRKTERIPWTVLRSWGKAVETEKHFELECGRGSFLVPKRCFPNSGEIEGFRRLLADKLGSHFQPTTG